MPSLGVLIRFKQSMRTLPAVLASLAKQTRKPDLLVGVDTGSQDRSRALLVEHGARIVDWPHRYDVAKVLNAGIAACPTDLVLVLSSHTVLNGTGICAQYVGALEDPLVAAASHRAASDRFFSDRIGWSELTGKGLTRGSIYCNSSSCLRRAFWQAAPFDERIPWGVEDYEWIIRQLQQGRVCRRFVIDRDYRRDGTWPWQELKTSRMLRALSARYGIKLAYDDVREARKALVWLAKTAALSPRARLHVRRNLQWLLGAATWRRHDPFRSPPAPPAAAAAEPANRAA